MVYNSVILFDTGVPVANVIPFPPVISSMYLHFINLSLIHIYGNRYGIYQINSGQDERGYQFLSMEAAKEMGFTVDGKD